LAEAAETRADGKLCEILRIESEEGVDSWPLFGYLQVELVVGSRKSDGVLKGIAEVIHTAGKKQLDPSKPAFVACFLEEVDDLDELATNSGLQRMTCSVLADQGLSHVAAIGYHGETVVQVTPDCQVYCVNRGLLFRNPNCRFTETRGFKSFSVMSETQANTIDL